MLGAGWALWMQQQCHLVVKATGEEEGFSGYARAITTQYYVTPLHLSNKTGATCTITLAASLYIQYGPLGVVKTKLSRHARL